MHLLFMPQLIDLIETLFSKRQIDWPRDPKMSLT